MGPFDDIRKVGMKKSKQTHNKYRKGLLPWPKNISKIKLAIIVERCQHLNPNYLITPDHDEEGK